MNFFTKKKTHQIGNVLWKILKIIICIHLLQDDYGILMDWCQGKSRNRLNHGIPSSAPKIERACNVWNIIEMVYGKHTYPIAKWGTPKPTYDRPAAWSADPLADPLIRWSADPLIHWLIRWSADPLADPLIRWLIRWSAGWSADPLIRWSAGWSADPLADPLILWSAGWSADAVIRCADIHTRGSCTAASTEILSSRPCARSFTDISTKGTCRIYPNISSSCSVQHCLRSIAKTTSFDRGNLEWKWTTPEK